MDESETDDGPAVRSGQAEVRGGARGERHVRGGPCGGAALYVAVAIQLAESRIVSKDRPAMAHETAKWYVL